MMNLAWVVPLFPLGSFILLLLFGRRWKQASAYVGIAATLLSLLLALAVLADRLGGSTYEANWTWMTIGSVTLTVGISVTALNAWMLVVVALVSWLVHVYSQGYMAGDERFSTFYAYLGLFTFAMLGLVLSPNLLQAYIFWELVGLGSFLLIGFYFYKEEAKAAAKKAFIMTRIGDVGFFIGMMLLFWQTHSFDYDDIFRAVGDGTLSPGMTTLAAISIFIGAIGKSGQFPLHTWLPDAMEGPTPVSALIHAATMVAAGVYLVAALFPLYEASRIAMMTVATIGGVTAIFAATIGLVQTDIKRVLAYSTVSQLGYMMLALGAGSYVAAIFHLTTHAFFKALLFLAAGSVIHAVRTQNIEEMGGLWRRLPWTAPLFLIGALSISGVPLFAGFFSKDEILAAAWTNGPRLLFWLAAAAALLTSFYIFRLFFLVFAGKARHHEDAHEAPASMVAPMLVLGVLSVASGYIQTPWFGSFLGEWLTDGAHHHEAAPGWIAVMATALSLAGILLAWLMYGKRTVPRDWLSARVPYIDELLRRHYYIDDIYRLTVVALVSFISRLLAYVDRFLVEGLARLAAGIVGAAASAGSRGQNGQVQTYGAVTVAGLAILVVIFALTGGYWL
ncbi:proton-translocating NADH-quinone oxidoreductase, chain L family protein [Geobacillus kaustophilus]|uniref:Proton-translocating NADH-quinone oxidoreductase, chain L family protein n=1 Tax=Geobacillus kaustophilus TaxID=1462 RepID=A0A0D8BVX2_GEOKU|nr:NADH-quinone oxidoreductase subunit L [Geobacillus kaustophilus]KJE28149.1 proton-translocating NADH-quinone oxidoreductase, chain L family protein [Geobacillus kaustophilus]